MIRCKRRTVFQHVIAVFFLWNMVLSHEVTAQIQADQQLGRSARSLTVFQPGDAVRIQIWELRLRQEQNERRDLNLNGDYPINPEGFIIMPLIGEVRVKDRTIYEIRQSLEEKYSLYLQDPYVYVRPLIRITLLGAVNQPGSYRADPASSFWDLIAAAGGVGSRADLKRMHVERGGKVVIKDVLLNRYEQGISLEEIGIETGDQIYTPAQRGINLMFLIQLIGLFTTITLLYLRLRSGYW